LSATIRLAQIYGLDKSGGVQALVMELVEGEDLSQRIVTNWFEELRRRAPAKK